MFDSTRTLFLVQQHDDVVLVQQHEDVVLVQQDEESYFRLYCTFLASETGFVKLSWARNSKK